MTYPTEKRFEQVPLPSKDFIEGLKAALEVVERRKRYYEFYRKKDEPADPQLMTTHPAVFQTLDEIILFISSMIEKAERGPTLDDRETVHMEPG